MTNDRIHSGAAINDIVAVTTVDDIVTARGIVWIVEVAVNEVITFPARDHVVAEAAGYDITAIASGDEIVPARIKCNRLKKGIGNPAKAVKSAVAGAVPNIIAARHLIPDDIAGMAKFIDVVGPDGPTVAAETRNGEIATNVIRARTIGDLLPVHG